MIETGDRSRQKGMENILATLRRGQAVAGSRRAPKHLTEKRLPYSTEVPGSIGLSVKGMQKFACPMPKLWPHSWSMTPTPVVDASDFSLTTTANSKNPTSSEKPGIIKMAVSTGLEPGLKP